MTFFVLLFAIAALVASDLSDGGQQFRGRYRKDVVRENPTKSFSLATKGKLRPVQFVSAIEALLQQAPIVRAIGMGEWMSGSVVSRVFSGHGTQANGNLMLLVELDPLALYSSEPLNTGLPSLNVVRTLLRLLSGVAVSSFDGDDQEETVFRQEETVFRMIRAVFRQNDQMETGGYELSKLLNLVLGPPTVRREIETNLSVPHFSSNRPQVLIPRGFGSLELFLDDSLQLKAAMKSYFRVFGTDYMRETLRNAWWLMNNDDCGVKHVIVSKLSHAALDQDSVPGSANGQLHPRKVILSSETGHPSDAMLFIIDHARLYQTARRRWGESIPFLFTCNRNRSRWAPDPGWGAGRFPSRGSAEERKYLFPSGTDTPDVTQIRSQFADWIAANPSCERKLLDRATHLLPQQRVEHQRHLNYWCKGEYGFRYVEDFAGSLWVQRLCSIQRERHCAAPAKVPATVADKLKPFRNKTWVTTVARPRLRAQVFTGPDPVASEDRMDALIDRINQVLVNADRLDHVQHELHYFGKSTQ